MDFLRSIGQAVLDALVTLWDRLLAFLPSLIAAIIILIIGIIVVKAIAKLIQKIVEALKVDPLVRKINIVQKIEEAGTKVILSEILAWLVKWFLYVVLFVALADILNLGKLAEFINDIAVYLPNVIVAVVILVVGLVLGEFVEKVLVNILRGTKAKLAPLAGTVAKWAIFVFAVLATLIQLGVAVALIQTLFTAVVITLALAAGLAFGLGGREAAKGFIEKMQQKIKE